MGKEAGLKGICTPFERVHPLSMKMHPLKWEKGCRYEFVLNVESEGNM